MCRHLCPVGLATGREVNTPRAKALLLSMVERGTEYDNEMANSMYQCLLCGACTNDCATGYEPPLFIREARTMAVVNDLVPENVQDIIDKIERTGNIYGVQKPAYKGNLEKADVLLYVGEVAAIKQPAMVEAVINLLNKADVSFSILENEPASGTFLGDLLGFVDEVRSQAKLCADAINALNPKTVVVLDSYEAVTMKQRYPEWGCEVKADVETVTSFISKLIEDGKLKPAKQTGDVTYHDDSRLARDLDEHEPARNIIKAMGYNLHEMFLNRRLAKCCGSSLFKAYEPKLALLTSEGRWDDVKNININTLITASPQVIDVMGENVPEGMSLKNLFVMLDKAC